MQGRRSTRLILALVAAVTVTVGGAEPAHAALPSPGRIVVGQGTTKVTLGMTRRQVRLAMRRRPSYAEDGYLWVFGQSSPRLLGLLVVFDTAGRATGIDVSTPGTCSSIGLCLGRRRGVRLLRRRYGAALVLCPRFEGQPQRYLLRGRRRGRAVTTVFRVARPAVGTISGIGVFVGRRACS